MALATEKSGCSATSGQMIAPLIELFTSEGCNSCPTADRWLSAVGRPNAGRVVVPLALHVDYWNHLGWEDPYASPDYTRRQYEYAHQRGTRTVYTPQFILNGREFRRWHAANADSEIASVAQTPATATITLSLQSAGERDLLVEASVMLAETMPDADLYFALYENGLTNKVDDGENAGRTLHHDFVARQLLGPFPVKPAPASRSRVAPEKLGRGGLRPAPHGQPRTAGARDTTLFLIRKIQRAQHLAMPGPVDIRPRYLAA